MRETAIRASIYRSQQSIRSCRSQNAMGRSRAKIKYSV